MAPPGKGPLRIALEDFIDGLKVGERVGDWFRNKGEEQREGSLGDAWSKILNEVDASANLPSFLQPGSAPVALGTAAVIPMLIGALIGLGFSFISVLIQPVALLAQYRVNRKFSAYRIDPRQLTYLLKVFSEKESVWIDHLLDQGVNKDTLDGLQVLNRQFLTAMQYIASWRREIISESELDQKLTQLWLFDTDQAVLKEATKLIPGPSDLILMAVREAWNEGVVQRFQYDDGFNEIPQFVEWMKKQGFDEEWARNYWRSHWQLPGITQVYEMLHRLRSGENQFTLDDMRTFLRTADIPAFFRDRLIAISYAPYTRVDIRRMFGSGVLDADQVYESYRDIGYDEEHARNLTEFTTRIEKAEERGLTREAIQGAYKRGIYSRSQAMIALSEIGYDETNADFWLDLTDFDIQAQNTDDILAAIQAKYEGGILDESTVHDELGRLDLPSEREQTLLEIWTIRRNNRIALPSRSELDDLRRRGIVDIDKYKLTLKQDGYQAETIEWFTTRIDQIVADDARVELEQTQAEQERVQRAERSSQYQKDRADLDVQIAQLKAAIADIQLAMHDVSDPDLQKQLGDNIAIYKNQIVQLNLSKAQLKLEFLTPPSTSS